MAAALPGIHTALGAALEPSHWVHCQGMAAAAAGWLLLLLMVVVAVVVVQGGRRQQRLSARELAHLPACGAEGPELSGVL